MFKKITAIFVATFYMLISVGFSVSIHHCDGMNETNISLVEETSCCCSIESSESDCCSNEEKTVQWEDDQQIYSSLQIDLKSLSMVLVKQQTDICHSDSQEIIYEHIDIPPPREQKSYLLFQQFTFYG